jgi:hypothetical protein
MRKLTGDNRTLLSVVNPDDKHPARISAEDSAFPIPGIPPIAVTEATGRCPHCGGNLVIVLEAQ